MSDARVALLRQRLDASIEWFFGAAMHVGIETEILIALVGLGVRSFELFDLVLVDQHLVAIDPSSEAV